MLPKTSPTEKSVTPRKVNRFFLLIPVFILLASYFYHGYQGKVAEQNLLAGLHVTVHSDGMVLQSMRKSGQTDELSLLFGMDKEQIYDLFDLSPADRLKQRLSNYPHMLLQFGRSLTLFFNDNEQLSSAQTAFRYNITQPPTITWQVEEIAIELGLEGDDYQKTSKLLANHYDRYIHDEENSYFRLMGNHLALERASWGAFGGYWQSIDLMSYRQNLNALTHLQLTPLANGITLHSQLRGGQISEVTLYFGVDRQQVYDLLELSSLDRQRSLYSDTPELLQLFNQSLSLFFSKEGLLEGIATSFDPLHRDLPIIEWQLPELSLHAGKNSQEFVQAQAFLAKLYRQNQASNSFEVLGNQFRIQDTLNDSPTTLNLTEYRNSLA
jgi:hypothetical protein